MQILQEFTAYLITRRRSPMTIKLQAGHVRRLMVEFPEPFAVTSFDLERYVALNGVRWMPRTVNSVIGSIRVFYKWAVRFGYVTTDPTKLLENVPVPDGMGRIIDDDSIELALPECTVEQRAMLMLGRMMGLRRSEIASLHTSNRHGEWLYVTGKGNKTRELHLLPKLEFVLDELAIGHEDGYYFPGRFGGHRSPESVYAIITRLVGSNPHSLRHGAGTAVYRGTGGDIRATQVFLGHSSIETTMRYVHVHQSALIRASEAADLPFAA